MSSDDDVTVNVKGATYFAMREKIQALDLENARLRAVLAESTFAAGGPVLGEALREALAIVGFAIGNLHPLTVRGWPHEALRRLSELATSPDLPCSLVDVALALTWRDFADKAKKWEDARARGEEHALLAEENATRALTADGIAALGIRVQIAPPPPGVPMLEVDPPEPITNHDAGRNE